MNILKKEKDNEIKKESKIKKFLKKFSIFGKDEKEEKKENYYSLKEVLIISLFCVALGVVTSITVIKILNNGSSITIPKEFNKMIETYNIILNNYGGNLDKKELIENAIEGMVSGIGDPYTTYSNIENSEEFLERLNGQYHGIGCEIALNLSGEIVVLEIFANSPSAKAGLEVGDIILEIDGESYVGKNASDMSKYVKNNKKDTIKIKIKRDNEEKELTIKLKDVQIPSVYSEIHEANNKKIGYMYITLFSSVTYNQFKEQLEKMEKDGITGLIIDVRQNSGGYLDVVTNICNILLPKNSVIYQLKKEDSVTKKYVTKEEKRTYPIAVLIDGVSASASEILAASIKESYNGFVVGTKSFGKGSVQEFIDLSDGSIIKYTTQKWLTPDGHEIDEVGIEPTHVEQLNENYINNPTMENDNQFQKALELVSS